MDEKEIGKRFAAFAQANIETAARQNEAALGHPTPYETAVDGVLGKPLAATKNTAITQFELGSDVVQWTWDAVKKASPVRKGRFKASQLLLADGVPIASPAEAPPNTMEFLIISTVPYARKIEGAGARKPQSAQAPNGVYEVTAAMAMRRYGNVAKIGFTYRELGPVSEMDAWAVPHAMKQEGSVKQRRQLAKNRRQPAIYILLR